MMEIIEKNENQITFKAKLEEGLTNSIRRYVSQIPVLAIEDVEISKNDSASYDETVAHRLGLIPLKSRKDTKTPKIKLSVKKEGMVYSDELTGAEIVFKKMPITFLNKNQEIEIVAETKMGKGIEHAKFSPGLMFYRNLVEITMDKDLKDKVKKIFPKNSIKEKGNKIILIDDKKKEVRDVFESISQKNKKDVEVDVKDELIVTIESFGQIDAKDIFVKSISELKKDLSEVGKKIAKG